ncbi:hypothetical protein NMG60_11035510 [Bertholletia excelsa]
MKNKLFLCFRPMAVEPESKPTGNPCLDDRVFTCIAVARHRDSSFSLVESPVSAAVRTKCSEKRDPSKSFSGAVRAVLFEISLKRKYHNRKSQNLLGSSSSESSRSEGFSDVSKSANVNPDSSSIKIDSPASISCSSLQSPNQKKRSIGLQQRSIGLQKQSKLQSGDKVRSCSSSNAGLLLIFVALAITVFYGRICSILFTSLCLFILCRLSTWEQLPPEKVAGLPPEKERPGIYCRKKAIMEGLLERNHQRRGH